VASRWCCGTGDADGQALEDFRPHLDICIRIEASLRQHVLAHDEIHRHPIEQIVDHEELFALHRQRSDAHQIVASHLRGAGEDGRR